jgi:GNAT superfamily N-acetyltransferase
MTTTPVLTLRRGSAEDAEACGRICYEAFAKIGFDHGFRPSFTSVEHATGVVADLLSHRGFYSVVAERDGVIVGSNFLDERSPIAGIGPITVDPRLQGAGVGRRLMVDVLERADGAFPGVRLVQASYNTHSLGLYAQLGFEVRESLAVVQGPPLAASIDGYAVRAAPEDDLAGCDRVCALVHGHDRSGELREAIPGGRARVVERDGRITGYTTGVAFFAHTVGEENEDVEALIGTAPEFEGPGFLLPLRNAELFRWCLDRGLRVIQLMTLMTRGLYNEPAGAFLPSILF